MKKLAFLLFTFVVAVSLTGCLTVEKKKYEIKIKKDGSGTMKITYINIFSQVSEDDSVDEVLSEDFSELLTDYIYGDKLEQDFPNAELVDKKLFEKNGQLWGEVVYKFDNYKEIGLYKYNDQCPYMFKFSGDEEYDWSNGSYDEDINLVIWEPKSKKLKLTTTVSEPDEDDISLLDMWKKNK